ncbi:DUF3667 domain-containing protein [Sphingomonas sp. LB-2]|uniref:DUF3667 domain-containing protein n=1 Tax=Sphingomonas caeni TaxID=2984949 RepID=UPI002230EA36|nr:DUF3667 domain-containing protein [Sphingomonas caeni]MCW3846605.1 DUF3667 domain-containing protein [Sphingomonas caeni]
MGELEAAGELVTGALLGRAMEPRAGESGEHGDTICLNCGTALIGPHCHRCGQSGHVHRTLSGMGHDILHGVFHFDGKLWHTLPLLAWRPGELTRRYIEGERARFVSPVALFLFSIFAMFAVFSWAGISAPTDLEANLNTPAAVQQAIKTAQEDRAELIETRDARAKDDSRRRRDDQRILQIDQRLKALDALSKQTGPRIGVSTQKTMTGWAVLDHGIEKWQKNPSLMLYKLQSSIYKFSWLLIPLSLPFVWLLFFWKRQYRLYDHAIFITYSIAFMSLLFIAITIAGTLGAPEWTIVLASLGIPVVHLFRQMKQAYQLRWFSALLRTIVLMVFIAIIVTIFLILLVVMGMF